MKKYLSIISFIIITNIAKSEENLKIDYVWKTDGKQYIELQNKSKNIYIENYEIKIDNIIVYEAKNTINPNAKLLIPTDKIFKTKITNNTKMKQSWYENQRKYVEKTNGFTRPDNY